MRDLRSSITENRFVEFVQDFMACQYHTGQYDQWVVDALASVNISLKPPKMDSQHQHHQTSINNSNPIVAGDGQ